MNRLLERKGHEQSPEEKLQIERIIRSREQMDSHLMRMSHEMPDGDVKDAKHKLATYMAFYDDILKDVEALE